MIPSLLGTGQPKRRIMREPFGIIGILLARDAARGRPAKCAIKRGFHGLSLIHISLAAAMAVALLLSKFTGGREVGMTGGADRLDLWSDGWEMFKQSPLYGHGYGSYVDTMNICLLYTSRCV